MEDKEILTEESVDEIIAENSEEKETPTNQEEVVTPEDTQEEKPDKDKEFQSIDAQKRYYREKVTKLEKQLSQRRIGGTSPMEVVKLAKALEGFNEEEVDFITRNSTGDKINDIIKASKDEWVKDAIETRRKKVEDNKKVPDSSSPDFASGMKTWKDIQKFGVDEKGKAEFREFAEKEEKRKSTGI